MVGQVRRASAVRPADSDHRGRLPSIANWSGLRVQITGAHDFND